MLNGDEYVTTHVGITPIIIFWMLSGFLGSIWYSTRNKPLRDMTWGGLAWCAWVGMPFGLVVTILIILLKTAATIQDAKFWTKPIWPRRR